MNVGDLIADVARETVLRAARTLGCSVEELEEMVATGCRARLPEHLDETHDRFDLTDVYDRFDMTVAVRAAEAKADGLRSDVDRLERLVELTMTWTMGCPDCFEEGRVLVPLRVPVVQGDVVVGWRLTCDQHGALIDWRPS